MRLFVAINLPEDVKKYLKSIQQLSFGPNRERGFSLAGDFHLTLQFIGEVNTEQALNIKSALYHVFMPKMIFRLGPLGVFKNGGKVRVVWIGLSVPKELYRVQSEVEEQLAPLGFFNDKKFTPHLTLARVKFCDDDFENRLKKISVEQKEFTADSFSLMESHLSSSGAEYDEIENYKS